VANIYEKILRTNEKDKVPCVLVGNKQDLKESRQVEFDDGKALAEQWGCPFFETSAKLKLNCEACFHELVREVRKTQAPPEKKKKKKCTIL
jgi:GTPase SAR1 family protein